jgi:hypothetical protein
MFEFRVARPGERAVLCGSGASRRDFLQVGALAAVGLSLPQYVRAASEGKVRPGHEKRSCIMIFNLGGPSNMDLWDMKPDAPAEIRGPFKPIRTKTDAFEISELLPKHAAIADRFSLVRSCHHDGAAVHDAGWQMMQTGRRFTGGIQTPHAGSVVAHLLGRRTDLPPFVVLPELMGRGGGNLPNGQAGGFLGKAQDPFALMADPSKPGFRVPDLLPPDQISIARLDRRRRMREIVEGAAKQFEASEDARLMDENFQAAYRLMTSTQAREAFDLAKEPQSVRERYGLNRFGQCCLLARRLVENGVRFVQVNLGGFDTHVDNFPTMRSLGAIIDPAIGTLLGDLASSGMLDRTLVLLLSEFGRTPVINGSAGRDHYPDVFSGLLAGGGIKRGFVLGGTDPEGRKAVERPVRVADLHATVVGQLGIDPDGRVDTPLGRQMKLINDGTIVADLLT